MGSFLDEETAETEKHLVSHSGCQVTGLGVLNLECEQLPGPTHFISDSTLL